MSLETTLVCGIGIAVIYLWIRWRRAGLKIFEELGIPGPPPHFIFGNILELNGKGPSCCKKEWIEKYGNIVGFFHGMKPILLVADPDLLRKIFIKDFHLFSDRPEGIPLRMHSFVDPIIPASSIMDNLIINLKGQHWKRVRSILSQAFSANKLKMMIPAVNKVTGVALSILERMSYRQDVINIYEVLQCLTLDLICAQAFAMDTDSLNNPSDPLLKSAKIIFGLPFTSSIVFWGHCFPELSFVAMIVRFLDMFFKDRGNIPPLKITKVLHKLIRQRREDPSMRRPDLLQLLIDASVSESEMESNATNGRDHPATESRKNMCLTDFEIKSNALTAFLAGYETTSSGLAYAFHFLAKYPGIQQKLQEEIDSLLEKEGHLDYYNVSNFQLMERFMLETMRFYPPGLNFVLRVAVADVDYGYIRIPKGLEISVPVEYVHQSDNYWNEPDEFNPDRFLAENATKNRSVAYWAFGVGPRSCIGTRLVHLTTKIVLANILHRFMVLPVNNQEKVKCHIKYFTMVPDEILVKLKVRQLDKKNS